VSGSRFSRLFHLTFYRCGSQWVRDILADSRGLPFRLGASGVDLTTEAWPEIDPGELAAPVYSASFEDWRSHSREGDGAVVVLRDPRDLVVSLVYSVAFSHPPTSTTRLLRDPLRNSDTLQRLQLGMFMLAQWADALRSWRDAAQDPRVLCIRYEDLIRDGAAMIGRLCSFAGTPQELRVLQEIKATHAFETHTGRKPGQENVYRHERKGIAGDWKNHFTRASGRLFEECFPCLLTSLGYEQGSEWWSGLAETQETKESRSDLGSLLRVLDEQNAE
jgi:hypothetical protein